MKFRKTNKKTVILAHHELGGLFRVEGKETIYMKCQVNNQHGINVVDLVDGMVIIMDKDATVIPLIQKGEIEIEEA